MADIPRARQILIVTGSSLRAEEADRPLAYYLRQEIEKAVDDLPDGSGPFHVHVVADFRWIHDEALQALPTVSLGGPGVNALSHRWLEDLPISLAVEEQYYIQMEPDLAELRASIWGMDNANTQIAVSVFVGRFLPRFLERCAAAELIDDEPDESDD